MRLREAIGRNDNPDTSMVMLAEIMRLTAKFLQLLCEGHNLTMQNLLRVQSHRGHQAVDFIEVVCTTLVSLVQARQGRLLIRRKMECKTEALIFMVLGYLLDTVIELIQGPCRANQMVLLKTAFVVSVLEPLVVEHSGMEEEEQQQVRAKSVICLLALLEGNTEHSTEGHRSNDILNRVKAVLPREALVARMDYLFHTVFTVELNKKGVISEDSLQAWRSNIVKGGNRSAKTSESTDLRLQALLKLPKGTFEGPMEEAFNIYILLTQISRTKVDLAALFSHVPHMFQFFEHYLTSIEVATNRVLTRVYFAMPPECTYLSEATRTKLCWSVDRSTAVRRIQGLMDFSTDLMEEIAYREALAHYPVILKAAAYTEILETVSFGITMFLNGFMLLDVLSPGLTLTLMRPLARCYVWYTARGGRSHVFLQFYVYLQHYYTSSYPTSTQCPAFYTAEPVCAHTYAHTAKCCSDPPPCCTCVFNIRRPMQACLYMTNYTVFTVREVSLRVCSSIF